MTFTSPLRLRIDSAALISNWKWLNSQSGKAAAGAAVKADGYGLGAAQVIRHLAQSGCRDFFVASWGEAVAVADACKGLNLSVLHGARAEDMKLALGGIARPVLSSPEQLARWRSAGGGTCDVMIDTGMNRLGLDHHADFTALLDGVRPVNLLSHLACADQDHDLNALQLDRFRSLRASVSAERYSLSNSAGICLGRDYHFDLTRPGIALYGGIPRESAIGHIHQVVTPQAQILQRRLIKAGDSVGYNATWTAPTDVEAAILNIGYADGYLRGFSNAGRALIGGVELPVRGRVSMDLLIIDCTAAPHLHEGDWVDIAYDLPEQSLLSGLSQYELLTGLGKRFDRVWL